MPDQKIDSIYSSFRENLLEHIFVSELLQEAWVGNDTTVEVLRSEVDSSGYDLVIEYRGMIRHIQLKSSRADAKTSRVTINTKLAEKPGGCIVWLLYDEDKVTRRIKLNYLIFDRGSDERFLVLKDFKRGKHSRGDASGIKHERPGTRVVPRSKFEKISSLEVLMDRLFPKQS